MGSIKEFLKQREELYKKVNNELEEKLSNKTIEKMKEKEVKIKEILLDKPDEEQNVMQPQSIRESLQSKTPISIIIKEKYYGKKGELMKSVTSDESVGKLFFAKVKQGLEDGSLELIAKYELVNELYSSSNVMIRRPNGKLEQIKPFPIAIVEIYKQKYDPNKLYVLIPLTMIIRARNKKIEKLMNNIQKLVDGYIMQKYSNVETYSDVLRTQIFSDVYSFILESFEKRRKMFPVSNIEELEEYLPLILDDILRYYADFGFGDIEYLFYDDQIEDIFINGSEQYVLAQTRDFYNVITTIYMTNDKLSRLKVIISSIYKSNFGETNPVIDTQIGGFFNIRVNMTYWSPTFKFSVDGYSLTLRKSREIPPTVSILLTEKFHSINEEIGAILVEFFHRNIGSLIYGETGSGKTTLLKSMLLTVPQHYRIVSLEDTVELPNMAKWGYNHVRLTARSELSAGASGWSLVEASKNLLRMRPYIAVLGEIRGKEAKTLAEMSQMGLATVYTTLHAEDHIKVLNRLVHHMDVEPSAIPSFDTLTLIKTIRPRGMDTIIRRLKSVAYPEVVYDTENKNIVTLSTGEETITVELKEIIRYHYLIDPTTKNIKEYWEIDWKNLFSGKLVEKIHDRTGMPPEVILLEIVEKYNLLKELKRDAIFDYKREMERSIKYFNMYNIINSDGWVGEELWEQFKKEMKYVYNIEIKNKWDNWILDKITLKEFEDWISVLNI